MPAIKKHSLCATLVRVTLSNKGGDALSAKTRHTLSATLVWPRTGIASRAYARAVDLPGAEELSVGQRVYLQGQDGRPIPVRVAAKDEKNITFDANHEMAGKELNFTIELVEVKD